MFADRHHEQQFDDSYGSENPEDMEAGYDTIEEEEEVAAILAEREDKEELRNIELDREKEMHYRERRL